MDKIVKILEEIKGGVDYMNETSLISDGIIESFDMITLIFKLNEEFGIEIGVEDVVPENFETVESIFKLVESKRG